MPRKLASAELYELLAGDHVARLATIDEAGYPHVTPLWFLHDDDVFHLASDTDRPHVARIRANPRVGLVIDTEAPERPDGQRPNRQVRIIGDAALFPDEGGMWSGRIWAKYTKEPLDQSVLARRLEGRYRTLISIRPHRVTAVASV